MICLVCRPFNGLYFLCACVLEKDLFIIVTFQILLFLLTVCQLYLLCVCGHYIQFVIFMFLHQDFILLGFQENETRTTVRYNANILTRFFFFFGKGK